MAILSIRIIGDPVLRTVADPVAEFGPELAKLVADMMETMEDVEGAGLAAPRWASASGSSPTALPV